MLCAVSGGMDSMYLLCRLGELGYAVSAAHYNHGIRGEEAERDETFVRRFCGERGIPYCSEKGDAAGYAAENGLSVEDGARKLRYAFLERAARNMGAAVIATAHNADDNAETLLLNLLRGTGLRGLGGIPPVRGNIRRPMLGISRGEIETYIRENAIPYVEDSTNGEDIYTRNRIRHEVMPVLRSLNPAFVKTAGRTAALLRWDGEFLDSLAASFVGERGEGNALSRSALQELPPPVRSRAVRQMAGLELTALQTEAVLALDSGDVTDVSGMRIGCAGDRLIFGVTEKPPIAERLLEPGVWTEIPEAGLAVKVSFGEGINPESHGVYPFASESIRGSIVVTSRREGDRFRPAGRGVSKSLKQVLREKDIPPWERNAVPVLRDEEGIILVYGVGCDERVRPYPAGKNMGKIEFIRKDRMGENRGERL